MSQFKFRSIVILFICISAWTTSCEGDTPIPTPTVTPSIAPKTTATLKPLPSPTEVITTPEPTPTKLPDVEGEISLWVDWSQAELNALYPHLTAFQERFPDIQISVVYFPTDELLQRYQDAVELGEEPTMIIGPSSWTELFVEDGSIRDVRGRLTQDFIDSIHSIAWEGVTINQSIFGLPFSLESIVLYRNRNIVPESPERLDDVVRLAQDIEDEEAVGIQLDVGFLYSGAFLEACEGELLGSDGELALTVTAGECWLEILQQWRLAGPVTLNTDVDLESFKAGRSGWLVDGTWNCASILDALGVDQVAVDPWPIYSQTEIPLAGFAWSRNIFFGSSTEDQDFDAAWILARYLLTEEVQRDYAERNLGLHVPVLKSMATDQRWLKELMTAISTNIVLPLFPEMSIFTEHLEVAAYDVARRGYNPYFVMRWEYFNIEKALRYARTGEE